VTKLKLRNLNQNDNDLLFKWANLKSVIKNSIRKKKLKKKNHNYWFDKQLKLTENITKIITLEDVPIGVVRLDKKKGNYYINYLIAPKFRKKGYGYRSLKFFLLLLKRKTKNLQIIALVKKDNDPSIKIFDKLNFKFSEIKSKVITYKYIIN
tara:strand:- start:39 stop:494 length:456 start_codon:yes stop_codon:yes gene_type:complete